MIELLAIPASGTPPRTLDDWADQLRASGGTVTVDHDPPGAAWLVVGPVGLRGYALIENGSVDAINFEVDAAAPAEARRVLEEAAAALGWELHEDDDDPEDEDED